MGNTSSGSDVFYDRFSNHTQLSRADVGMLYSLYIDMKHISIQFDDTSVPLDIDGIPLPGSGGCLHVYVGSFTLSNHCVCPSDSRTHVSVCNLRRSLEDLSELVMRFGVNVHKYMLCLDEMGSDFYTNEHFIPPKHLITAYQAMAAHTGFIVDMYDPCMAARLPLLRVVAVDEVKWAMQSGEQVLFRDVPAIPLPIVENWIDESEAVFPGFWTSRIGRSLGEYVREHNGFVDLGACDAGSTVVDADSHSRSSAARCSNDHGSLPFGGSADNTANYSVQSMQGHMPSHSLAHDASPRSLPCSSLPGGYHPHAAQPGYAPVPEPRPAVAMSDAAAWSSADGLVAAAPRFMQAYAIETPDAPIGVGQFGVVYAARPYADPSRRVAVKRITLQHQDPEQLQRVFREVEILAAVGPHPHVVRLHEYRRELPYLFLVMDLYQGGDLLHHLNASPCKHDRALPPTHPHNLYLAQRREREAARISGQLASALQFLHLNGVSHRDLKPENILLETSAPDSPIRLVDFGLSRMLPPGEETMRTKCGTDAYAAPEVLAADRGGARGYHRDVDIWSLGLVLFVLLCHYHPFDTEGRSVLDYAAMRAGRIQTDTPEWAGISAEAQALVRRLVVVDPDRRMSLADFLNSPWMARHRN